MAVFFVLKICSSFIYFIIVVGGAFTSVWISKSSLVRTSEKIRSGNNAAFEITATRKLPLKSLLRYLRTFLRRVLCRQGGRLSTIQSSGAVNMSEVSDSIAFVLADTRFTTKEVLASTEVENLARISSRR